MAELVKEHHKKKDAAYDRPSYREGRWEKAVKVYTVNQESRYLLVQNVHALGVVRDLLELCSLYGDIEEYRLLDEYPSEPYTDVYWIKYASIQAARIAKKKLDNRSFFGKQLHVCYAPEFENVQDTREKLQQRRKTIALKTKETFEKAKKELVAQKPMAAGSSSTSCVVGEGESSTAVPSFQSDQISHSSEVADHLSHPRWYSVPNLPPLPHLPPPPPPPLLHPPPPPPSQTNPLLSPPPACVQPSSSTSQSLEGVLRPPLSHTVSQPESSNPQRYKHPQPAKGNVRDKNLTVTRKMGKGRKKEDGGAFDESVYNRSGLSQQERVSLYLQTTETGFQDVTSLATNQNPSQFGTSRAGTSGREGYCSKLVERQALIERRTGRDSSVSGGGVARGGDHGRTQEEQQSIMESPRLMSGNRSVDTTVQTVRAKMAKVWDQPPLLTKSKTVKRKRI